jgi:hypothetical protein
LFIVLDSGSVGKLVFLVVKFEFHHLLATSPLLALQERKKEREREIKRERK